MIRLSRMLVLCALFAAPIAAQELVLAPDDVELLPLDEIEMGTLQRDHRRLSERVQGLTRRRVQLSAQLAKEPNGEGAPGLREQLAQAEGELDPLLAKLTEVVRADFGVDDVVVRRIRKAPCGRNRISRYAHGLVLDASPLSAAQRELLVPLVAAVDGALLGQLASQQRARAQMRAQEDERARLVVQGFDVQRRETERRFWQIVDIVLDTEQAVAVRALLPHEFATWADVVAHSERLPDLTPSQSARLQALRTEIESESAADQVEVRRLQQELRRQDLAQPERQELTTLLQEAQGRLLDLRIAARASSREILSPAQIAAFEAIPPFVTAGDRSVRAENLVRGLVLTPDQTRALASLTDEYKGARADYEQRASEIRSMGDGFSPESPQQEMMQSMMTALQGEGNDIAREAGRRICLDILEPGQVVDWVLGIDETE